MHEEIREIINNLTNEQRALLISDGSVTSLLEAFTGKQVVIRGIKQKIIKSNKNILKDFGIKEDNKENKIIKREVTLSIDKFMNDEPVIYAISFAPLSRINDLKDDFLNKDKPIGRILKEHNIEYRREIFKISVPSDNTFKKFFKNALMREYFIIHKNERIIKIKEYLNLDFKFNNII